MRLIIAGGREVPSERADCLVRAAIEASGWESEITEVYHGASAGVYITETTEGIDSAADRVCRDRWPTTKVPADWTSQGKAAGPIRNRKMAGMADALIAIWDEKSRGTKNMIEEARKKGLRVFVFPYV